MTNGDGTWLTRILFVVLLGALVTAGGMFWSVSTAANMRLEQRLEQKVDKDVYAADQRRADERWENIKGMLEEIHAKVR